MTDLWCIGNAVESSNSLQQVLVLLGMKVCTDPVLATDIGDGIRTKDARECTGLLQWYVG